MSGSPSSGEPAPTLSPAQRLEASRARLRTAIQTARAPASNKPSDRADDDGELSFIDTLLRSGRRVWARHPLRGTWRVAQQLAGPLLAAELKPLVRRHPLRLLAIAAGVGAALAWLRPWRVLPQAALGSALLSLALPRRALWQELMSSGLIDRLVSGELLARWFAQASPEATDDAQAQRPARTDRAEPPPTAPEPDVLHRMEPGADAARAA